MKAAALSLFLLLPAALSAGQAPDGELERARKAAASGSYAKAFDIAMLGLKSDPDDHGLFLLAVEVLPENSPSRAKLLADFVAPLLKKKTRDYAWHLGACKALRILSEFPGAIANCRRALEAEPTAYPPYRELGLTYAAAGRNRMATETLSQGVEISSTSYRARYHLARVLEKRGDTVRAGSAYKAGYELARKAGGPDAGYYSALLRAGMKRTAARKKRPAASPRKPAPEEQAAGCMASFRKEFLKDNLGTALQVSDRCVKLSPKDPALAAERAPLMVRLGKYEDGVAEYERAADLYGDKGAQAALCRVKAAETWQKLKDPEKALAQYKLARKADPGNMSALRGLAAAMETRSDFKGAAEAYGKILELDPGDKKTRRRLEELAADVMSGEQIFGELRRRAAVEKGQKGVRPGDIALFKALKAAELAGAVDYLKKRSPGALGVSVKAEEAGVTRVLLTGRGYRLYVALTTKDAIKFFEKEGLGFREIFKLRTQHGSPVFDKSGRLTPAGQVFWREAVPGKKTWLLSYEPVPASPQAVRANREMEDAEANGYREISEPEYLWLLRATDCPEDVMRKSPLSLKVVNDGARVRYMLCFVGGSSCMNPINAKLPSYIESYRAGNDYISDAKASTAFFGTGAVKKHRFCEDGKIFGVDTSPAAPPALP